MSSVVHRGAVVVSALLAVFACAPALAGAQNDRPPAAREVPAGHATRSAEQFRPASIQSFVADSDLEQFGGGTWSLVDSDPEPGELPAPGTGTWRLNQDSCVPFLAIGGLACYAAAGAEGDGASVVYGRVARPQGAIVLQYWYFYYDNTYSYAYPASNFIWQAHEGDWEVVNVVLSEDEEPQFVGYSQHCRGQRRDWATTPQVGTHPVVHVAAGSHANYFSAGVTSHPDRVHPAAGDRLSSGGGTTAAGRSILRRR